MSKSLSCCVKVMPSSEVYGAGEYFDRKKKEVIGAVGVDILKKELFVPLTSTLKLFCTREQLYTKMIVGITDFYDVGYIIDEKETKLLCVYNINIRWSNTHKCIVLLCDCYDTGYNDILPIEIHSPFTKEELAELCPSILEKFPNIIFD